MRASAAVPDWRECARRLADQLTADGDLHTSAWREALLVVPRHEFVPRYYVLHPGTTALNALIWLR